MWDFATTRDLIDAIRHRPVLRRLCGWESLGEVPSEATFSRAFDAFARDDRPQQIHEAMLKTHPLHEEHGGRHVRNDGPIESVCSVGPAASAKNPAKPLGRKPSGAAFGGGARAS